MRIKTLACLTTLVIWGSHAQATKNVIDHPELLYNTETSTGPDLDQKITVEHQFHGMNEFVAYLNHLNTVKLHFNGYYLNDKPLIWVNMDNVTIRELLDQAGRDFGYTWHTEPNNVITFTQIGQQSYGDNVQATWQVLLDDSNIRNTLARWCKIAGWQLVWNVNASYPIRETWTIEGNLKFAINQVLIALSKTRLPLKAKFHQANKVLEIDPLTK